MSDLVVDLKREGKMETGIYVRAKNGDEWGAYDISDLTESSLREWLKSRGGDNEWAEGTVCILLGHGRS